MFHLQHNGFWCIGKQRLGIVRFSLVLLRQQIIINSYYAIVSSFWKKLLCLHLLGCLGCAEKLKMYIVIRKLDLPFTKSVSFLWKIYKFTSHGYSFSICNRYSTCLTVQLGFGNQLVKQQSSLQVAETLPRDTTNTYWNPASSPISVFHVYKWPDPGHCWHTSVSGHIASHFAEIWPGKPLQSHLHYVYKVMSLRIISTS